LPLALGMFSLTTAILFTLRCLEREA
jgi:hypothetical protein